MSESSNTDNQPSDETGTDERAESDKETEPTEATEDVKPEPKPTTDVDMNTRGRAQRF